MATTPPIGVLAHIWRLDFSITSSPARGCELNRQHNFDADHPLTCCVHPSIFPCSNFACEDYLSVAAYFKPEQAALLSQGCFHNHVSKWDSPSNRSPNRVLWLKLRPRSPAPEHHHQISPTRRRKDSYREKEKARYSVMRKKPSRKMRNLVCKRWRLRRWCGQNGISQRHTSCRLPLFAALSGSRNLSNMTKDLDHLLCRIAGRSSYTVFEPIRYQFILPAFSDRRNIHHGKYLWRSHQTSAC